MPSLSEIFSKGIPLILIERQSVSQGVFLLIVAAAVLISSAAGYLAGSLNSAIIVSRSIFKKDIREYGSGNAGMTNMFRVFGRSAGLLTLAGDVAKTAVACVAGYLAFGYNGCWIAGFFCVLGHMFPCWYRFRGGKGVLVSAAVLLFADWPVFLGAITVFLIVLVGTKYVSLSSIMASLLMPLLLHIFFTVVSGDGSSAGLRLPIAVAMAAVVVFSHRENIKRIREKKEPKITLPWEKKKKEKEKGSSGTGNAGDAPSGDKKGRKKR
ncbi:MAG: glycerol-3-phosphate 1-O-acyltransferase PlsY [Clostridia bacterium]|nr:glycerol-3-phosphate 1-O-acyltransferase PlsY [Clostridia bacterium]